MVAMLWPVKACSATPSGQPDLPPPPPPPKAAYAERRRGVSAGHDWRYTLTAEKIGSELGWRARIPFEHGLRDTIAWYASRPLWWEPIRDRISCDYYPLQYGDRLQRASQ